MSVLDSYRATMSTIRKESPFFSFMQTHHTNKRGRPMRFGDRPCMLEMITDLPHCRSWCLDKATQTGISEILICYSLYAASQQKKHIATMFPVAKVASRFTVGRVDPLIARTPDYKKHLGTNNVRQKIFGGGSLLYLASKSESDILEFSADVGIVDEVSACHAGNLAKFEDRLMAAEGGGQLIYVGNPTVGGVGSSRLYDLSDQRLWFHRCPRCNYWQPIDWFANMARQLQDGKWTARDPSFRGAKVRTTDRVRPVCVRCVRAFELTDSPGCWVAADQDIEARGYRISRMNIYSDPSGKRIVDWQRAQGNPTDLQAFYNSVLGLPFAGEGSGLTLEILQSSAGEYRRDPHGGMACASKTIAIGVDVGKVLNVVVSEVLPPDDDDELQIPNVKILDACTVGNFDDLKSLIKRYRANVVVVDALPETHAVGELVRWGEASGFEILSCTFTRAPRTNGERFGYKAHWAECRVNVNRTQLLDANYANFVGNKTTIPSDFQTCTDFVRQMCAPIRQLNEDKTRAIWHEGSTPDHYCLASAYMLLASEIASVSGSSSVC